MKDLQKVFEFQEKPIRMQVDDNKNVWIAAKDASEILNISKYRDVLANFPEDERMSMKVDTLGGPQEMIFINEPGLYRLIFSSRKKEAEVFKRWVFHEVIPSIRKTDKYEVVSQNKTETLLNLIHDPDFKAMKAVAQVALIRSIAKITKEEKLQEPVNQSENNFEIQLVTALVELIENESLAHIHYGEIYWPCDALKELITKHTGQDMSYQRIIAVLNNIEVINSKRRFNIKKNGKKNKIVHYSLKIKTIKLLANKYNIGVTHIYDHL